MTKDPSEASRDDWPEISLGISKSLEDDRIRFFESCLERIEKSDSSKVVNRSLAGSADLALKGYQLGIVPAFLEYKQLLREEDAQQFATLLYAQVCGTKIEECLEYLHRYYMEKRDGAIRLVSDVIRYITNSEDVDSTIAMGLLVSEFMLSANAQIWVAVHFRDEILAKQLMDGTKRALEEMARRFR